MQVTLQLPEDVADALSTQAQATKKEPASIIVETLRACLVEGEIKVPTVDLQLAAFRDSVAKSGVSDEHLDEFFQNLRQEAWDAKHPAKVT